MIIGYSFFFYKRQLMPSSVVSKMEYDNLHATLKVTFVSGLVYQYKNVPEEIYVAMKTSGAKGIYLNKFIKGNFAFEKIERGNKL